MIVRLLVALLLAAGGHGHGGHGGHGHGGHGHHGHRHHQRRCYKTGLTRCLEVPPLELYAPDGPPVIPVTWDPS